jgi:DNA-directed RNA polymerase subunit RPC12/RpoP
MALGISAASAQGPIVAANNLVNVQVGSIETIDDVDLRNVLNDLTVSVGVAATIAAHVCASISASSALTSRAEPTSPVRPASSSSRPTARLRFDRIADVTQGERMMDVACPRCDSRPVAVLHRTRRVAYLQCPECSYRWHDEHSWEGDRPSVRPASGRRRDERR